MPGECANNYYYCASNATSKSNNIYNCYKQYNSSSIMRGILEKVVLQMTSTKYTDTSSSTQPSCVTKQTKYFCEYCTTVA